MAPYRNHVEARSSRKPARQYVSETHDHKPDAPSATQTDAARTYPWKVAKMLAGKKTAQTGVEHVAISNATGQQWGPAPYRVVAKTGGAS